VRLAAGGLLPLLGRFGVEFQDQLVRGASDLTERQARGRLGQDLVGAGGVLVAQDAGLVLDDPKGGWICPAASAAKVRGSRRATADA
jgi:hypothetical protein